MRCACRFREGPTDVGLVIKAEASDLVLCSAESTKSVHLLTQQEANTTKTGEAGQSVQSANTMKTQIQTQLYLIHTQSGRERERRHGAVCVCVCEWCCQGAVGCTT